MAVEKTEEDAQVEEKGRISPDHVKGARPAAA